MGTFLIIVALAAGARLFRGREGSRRIRAGWVIAALLPLGLGLSSCSNAPDLQAYEEVAGYRMGELLLEAVDGDGPVLVLRSPSDLGSDEPTAGRSRGLRKACSGHAVIEAGPDLLSLGPPSDDFHILAGEDWADQVAAWCEQYPDAVAVVSLLFEFPPLETSWSQDLPPLYGFTAGPSQAWAEAMQEGVLKAIIRYRPGATIGGRESPSGESSPEDAFDHHFELVTPENLRDALADGP